MYYLGKRMSSEQAKETNKKKRIKTRVLSRGELLHFGRRRSKAGCRGSGEEEGPPSRNKSCREEGQLLQEAHRDREAGVQDGRPRQGA